MELSRVSVVFHSLLFLFVLIFYVQYRQLLVGVSLAL